MSATSERNEVKKPDININASIAPRWILHFLCIGEGVELLAIASTAASKATAPRGEKAYVCVPRDRNSERASHP